MTMAHDLLEEPLLTWRDRQGNRAMTTLPGILQRLGSGELVDFPRTRAHQFDPWSMFLTQLAAIALQNAGVREPHIPEAAWKTHLLALSGGKHEPWCLVVADLAKPAFFQSPVPEGTLDAWKGLASRPDSIDVLVTSKAHDVKTGLVDCSDIEAWIYALTTLQTTQGYPGRGYNRISRMKGGYGSRPRISVSGDPSPASRFARDVLVMLETWPAQLSRGYSDEGVGLVWTTAWDGNSSLAMGDLCPGFVEICWRMRLRPVTSGIVAAYTTTNVRRCLPEVENGDVGDPWIPVERDGGALTISHRGFSCELLTRLLFSGDFEPAVAQVIKESDGDPVFLLTSAMARGQGKTEGLHERCLVISGKVRRQLGLPDGRAALGKRATHQIEQATKMRSKVLFPSLKKIGLGEQVVQDSFDQHVDEIFFPRLLGDMERPEDEARLIWEKTIKDFAWAELQRAIERCCVPSARRFKAISEAEGMFRGCLKNQFPDLTAASAGGTNKEATP
jgi:CRISPR system Cascade subunit CasA